jgi:hypothetical protein
MSIKFLRYAGCIFSTLVAVSLSVFILLRKDDGPLAHDLIVAGAEKMSVEWRGRSIRQFEDKYGRPSEQTGSGFAIYIYNLPSMYIKVVLGSEGIVRIAAETDDE